MPWGIHKEIWRTHKEMFAFVSRNSSNIKSMAAERGAQRRVAILQRPVALQCASSIKVRHLEHFGSH